jgi:hypothetical protein
VKVDYVQVWRFVHAEGLSSKKSVLLAEQLWPKISRQRERWKTSVSHTSHSIGNNNICGSVFSTITDHNGESHAKAAHLFVRRCGVECLNPLLRGAWPARVWRRSAHKRLSLPEWARKRLPLVTGS